MAEIEVFNSEFTAEQIEDEIENGVPYIDSTTKHWMRWDIDEQEYVDTGIRAKGESGSGSGDMLKEDYDSDYAVENAGGIASYITAYHARGTTDPTTATTGLIGQLYTNTTTNKLFQCTAISGSTYTWVAVGAMSYTEVTY